MIPVKPPWATIVNKLYARHGSYKRMLVALAEYGVQPDYSTLSHLRCGYAAEPKWKLGAALLNLYEQK